MENTDNEVIVKKVRFPRKGISEEEKEERARLARNKATVIYRMKHLDDYREYQRSVYHRKIAEDPEYKAHISEKNKRIAKNLKIKAGKTVYEKQGRPLKPRADGAIIADDTVARKRGRPLKPRASETFIETFGEMPMEICA
jgi:hypothetical protein